MVVLAKDGADELAQLAKARGDSGTLRSAVVKRARQLRRGSVRAESELRGDFKALLAFASWPLVPD